MVAVLVAGIAIASTAIKWATIHSYQENPPAFTKFVVELVEQASISMNVEQFEDFFQTIADNNADYILVSEVDGELPQDVVDTLIDGNTIWLNGWEWPDQKYHGGLAVHLPGTMNALIMRPTQPPFPPISSWLTILMVSAAVIVLAGFSFLVPIVKRLRELEIKANDIASGKYICPDDAQYPRDAIGYLAQAMDDMASRIHSSLDKQSHMIMAIAHELRTPISRIQFGIEMLSMTDDPVKRNARRQAIDADITELDQMVAELLTYSRYDSQQEMHGGEVVEISIPDTVDLLKERLGYAKPEISIICDFQENLPKNVFLSLHPFNRVLSNLVGNALRYAKSRIVLSYTIEKGELLVFHVDDDGNGVPPEERQRVFEPFTRLEKSRERDKGGVGLGLAIVAQIMRTVGGRVFIEDAPCGGARFTLHWPLGK